MTIATTSETAALARPDRARPRRPGVTGTGSVSVDLPPLPFPDSVPCELHPLLPLRSYRWQSVENHERAQRWLWAALRLLDETGTSYYSRSEGARQSIEFLVRQTVDVHHHDRAQHAARFLPERPAPQRLSVIPPRAKVAETPDDRPRWYDLQLIPLQFASDIPFFATDRVASLPPSALPDRWHVARYVKRQRVDDPVIYAQYGDWYVKVAEWT